MLLHRERGRPPAPCRVLLGAWQQRAVRSSRPGCQHADAYGHQHARARREVPERAGPGPRPSLCWLCTTLALPRSSRWTAPGTLPAHAELRPAPAACCPAPREPRAAVRAPRRPQRPPSSERAGRQDGHLPVCPRGPRAGYGAAQAAANTDVPRTPQPGFTPRMVPDALGTGGNATSLGCRSFWHPSTQHSWIKPSSITMWAQHGCNTMARSIFSLSEPTRHSHNSAEESSSAPCRAQSGTGLALGWRGEGRGCPVAGSSRNQHTPRRGRPGTRQPF